MQKLKLLIGGVAALLLGGVNSVYAYTVDDLTRAGWTQITSISQSDITDKYYVFVANDADLVLGLATSSNQGNTAAFYQTLANPALDAKKVWTLEVNGSNYAMRNLYSNSRQMQTEWSASSSDLRWRTNDQTSFTSWTGLSLAYSDEAWTLTSTQYNRPLGIYNNGTGTPTEGQEIGANDAGKGQKFRIYAINRNAYWTLAAGLATIDNPVLSFTGLISNQEIYNNNKEGMPTGWSEDTSARETGNNNRTAGTGVTVLEAWSGSGALSAHYYQNISEVPSGVYRLTATAQDRDGTGGGNIYIGNGTTEQQVTFGTTAADVTTPNYIFDGGTLTIGLRANGTASWVNATDFRLACLGKLIRQAAIEIHDDESIIAANQWYKYDVEVSGNYTITAGSTEGFIQTADGEQMAENGTGAAIATGTDVALTVGSTIYYKSTSANTLTIVLKTKGAISDGTYYFQKKGTQQYLGRGGNWGTEAVVADLGISFELAIHEDDGTYTFKNRDHSLAAKKDLYLNYDGGAVYTDKEACSYFTLEATDGGYYLRPNATHYLTSNNYSTDIDVAYDFITHTENVEEAIVWVPINKETYQANVAAVRDAEAAAVANRAGVSASTLSALKSAVASDFISSDLTSKILNAACVENLTSWTQVKYAANGHKPFDANGTCGEVYDGHGGIKQSIEGLEKGLYKVSVHATWRPGTKESGEKVGSEINTNAWVYANTATSANLTQLKSWHEGGATIDSRADMKASGDTYLNDVYVYVSEGETLTIGLASPTKCNGAWLPFFGWTLTRYDAKATADERQALDDAISNAEANLGFEDGEYAPYNNLEAIALLNAAKGIDLDNTLGTDVVAATTELNNAWKANVGEVNAFCGGDFTVYETIAGEDFPKGWNLYNGVGNHSRIMGGSEGTGNTGLSASSSGKALLLKSNATYGESEGYTMPLKAGKIYKITFKHGRWNEANPRLTDVVMTDPSGASITLAPAFQAKNNSCESNAANWETYTGYFVSTTAGNYKFNLTKQGGTSQMQIGIADIDLRTASELEFADGTVPTYAPGTYPSVKITRSLAAGRWATAVYPFAVSGVDDIAVLDSYNASTGVLGFKSATASTANVPFLMRSTSDATEISISEVAVAAAATDPGVTVNNVASLKGTYTQMTVDAGEGVYNYVLSNNTIYKVGQNEAIINPYRAYIQLTQPVSEARALSFFIDGDATSDIEGITVEDANDGPVFSLSGQRVASPRKGLYIRNGQKVLVK